jgi:AcrR family transcriptional regulator
MNAKAATEEPAGESRQRILDAATRLMAERGYSGTSISMITRLSGLPASSTYWHFGSKEQLLGAVIENAATTWLRSLPRYEDLRGRPRERFRKLMLDSAGRPGGHELDFLRLLFMISLEQAEGRGEVMATVRRVRQQVKKAFLRAFADTYGEPKDARARARVEELADFTLAASDGIYLAGQIETDVNKQRLLELLVTAFFCLAEGTTSGASPR